MNLESKKQEALERILSDRQMQRVIELEPGIRTILALAADPQPRENRWVSYEALKRMMQPYIGFDARQEELRTCQHYDRLIEAIDELLPKASTGYLSGPDEEAI